MALRPVLLAALLALPAGAAAATEIVRCTASGGSVTYQQAPCPDRSEERRPAIPTEFPAPNVAARDELFEREAALYRRLEARRDRELQESQMREARAEREAERERLAALVAAQSQPQYLVAYPLGRFVSPRRPINGGAGPRHGGPPVYR